MSLSVIIPTYQRYDDLPRLLASVSKQVKPPLEVIVVVGPNDVKSIDIALEWQKKSDTIKIIESSKASVINALNQALKICKGDIIALLDDDVWLPPNWANKVEDEFTSNPRIGGFGGRDHLQLENKMHLSNPPLARHVGVYKWNGELIGNHHQGIIQSPASVDVLKGCNFSFSRTAFEKMQIDENLISRGAETCWEIDICQQIKDAGFDLIYSNDNYVLHYASPRLNFDHRDDLFSPSWSSRVFNSSYVMMKYRPLFEVLMVTLKSIFIGSRVTPGFIRAALLIPKYGIKTLILPWRYAKCTLAGVRRAIPFRKGKS